MNKVLGATAKRNRIANYMDSFPEEFEVVEDNLGESDPSIKLQTKTRIISLSCDGKGKVNETFRMRQGAGSREVFLAKQEAYNAINAYYNDYYTGAKVTKNSFEEGELKIDLEGRTVTLTYDSKTKSVEEKDRAKRKPKAKPAAKNELEFQQMSLFDLTENLDKPKKTTKKVEKEEKSEPTVKIKKEENSYEKWSDGITVKNICNNKEYKVKHDLGNIIEVFDKDYGYLIMARADLKVVNDYL
jgi:hypothetical protein